MYITYKKELKITSLSFKEILGWPFSLSWPNSVINSIENILNFSYMDD